MKKLNTDFKYLSILFGFLICGIVLTYAHHGNLIIDNGREVYLPTQILSGHILYKDIFNIYGPFSYMFNTFLFKIFGINLNVLYITGCICAFSIVNLIYLISRKFLSEFLSFSIALLTIATGILNLNLFNFVFPYSYGMLYGLVSFLISFLLLLKYQKTPDKTFYLYLSSFFAGLSFANKYDFLPYALVILSAMIKIKPLRLKEYYYTVFSLACIPVFCFGVLFLQGLKLSEMANAFLLTKKISQTQTLKYFYQIQGAYFNKKTMGFLFINFIRTIVPLSLLIYGFKTKRKILSAVIILLAAISASLLVNPASFAFLPILIIILALINFKKIQQSPSLLLLTLSAIAISFKSFWGLATLNYGVFFLSFLLITALALASEMLKNKNINFDTIGVYILIAAAISGYTNLLPLKVKTFSIDSNKGRFFTNAAFYYSTNDLINYINKNTKKTDKIVILPEGLMINFMTQRPSDNLYFSLIPLYVETFGEDKIINHFKKSKPEYIVFNNWDTSNYYFHHICEDYALSFCSFVATNYTQVKLIDKNFRYLVFKRKS